MMGISIAVCTRVATPVFDGAKESEIKTALIYIKDQLALLNAGLAPPPRARTPKGGVPASA